MAAEKSYVWLIIFKTLVTSGIHSIVHISITVSIEKKYNLEINLLWKP